MIINLAHRFLSLLEDITNQPDILLDLKENSNVNNVIQSLVNEFGMPFESVIFDPSRNVSEYIIFAINGKDIRSLNGLDSVIQEGDEIALIPAIAGD